MPAFNFKSEWAANVELGAAHANGDLDHVMGLHEVARAAGHLLAKRTTIRREGRCTPLGQMSLYTGQRTRACRLLGRVLCLSVTPISFSSKQRVFSLGDKELSKEESEYLARLDTANRWGRVELIQFLESTYRPDEALALYMW